MRAVTWQGRRKVSVETVPDPVIKEPTDAIIRVTSTNICGSDLHLYEVLGAFMTPGDMLGHEADGRRRGGRQRRQGSQGRRSGGDPVQHLLRALLHVRPGAAEPVRDHAEPRTGHGRRVVRLLQALRRGGRRAGRVPARAPGAVHPHQGARRRDPTSATSTCPMCCRPPGRQWSTRTCPTGGTLVVLGLGPIGSMACRIAHHRNMQGDRCRPRPRDG